MDFSINAELKTPLEKAKFSILVIVSAALLIALFVWLLSFLLLVWQACANVVGYRVNISDEIAKTVLQIGGAVAVAFVALYGVHRQNLSAERRHQVDSNRALKKDIFLRVAEAASIQHQYLLSYGNPTITDSDRQSQLNDSTKAFFSLQMVANQETICAMLDANEEWAKAVMNIAFLGNLPVNATQHDRVTRLGEIQKLTVPFMQKLWRFNIVARKEIESDLDDENSYFFMVSEKYGRIGLFFEELKNRLN